MIGELMLITGMLISNPDLHNGTVNLPEKNPAQKQARKLPYEQ